MKVAWSPTILTAVLAFAACGNSQKSASIGPAEAPPEVTTNAPTPAPAKEFKQKIWIIGFDGVDPDWLQQWIKAGKLPNLKRLIEQGSFKPLRSTNPPQSPVAWASFATGTNPGGHGIYDFLRRDPATYLPSVGTGDVQNAEFGPDGSLLTAPKPTNYRTGPSFWKLAADQGVRTVALNVPYSFPCEPMQYGRALAGLGTPDLRGTNSTFTFFSTKLTPEEVEKGASGGRLVALAGTGPTYDATFDGPKGASARAMAKVTFEPDPGTNSVNITLGGRTEKVGVGRWSDWFEYEFEVTASYRVKAIGRLYVGSFEPLEIFMYPPNIHPDAPWIPISFPESYASTLKSKFGLFKTVGWTHDTNGLNSEKISDGPWLEDVWHAMDKLVNMGLGELDAGDASLFLWVETATDRVSHMFTRATDRKSPRFDKGILKEAGGDPILASYQRMDEVVGKLLPKLTPDTTLLILSDHGFHTFRRGLHINAWLVEQGFMVLNSDVTRGEKTTIFSSVDWSKTRAYALGTGQIYINLEGREGQGIVTSAEYEALVNDIVTKLEKVVDSQSKEKPVSKVYKRGDIYQGLRFDEAPDLQVAFHEGWRTSSETMLGGIPNGLFSDNMKKWSGDHAASDVADTDGILICNRPILIDDPAIIDIAPTVLTSFGLAPPPTFEGRDLFKSLTPTPTPPTSPSP